jgi:hypothetical protein
MSRLIALAAAAMLVAGCSFTRLAYMSAALAYSNATPMAVWWVDDYVDLSGEQREWVRARIASAHAWHRAQELPEYRRWLETLLDYAADGISVDEAGAAYRELRARYHRLLAHMAPDVADFLLQLDAAQIAQLERKFADDERRMVKDSLEGTAEVRQARRVRMYLEHIEEWTGGLSGSQRELDALARARDPELFERLSSGATGQARRSRCCAPARPGGDGAVMPPARGNRFVAAPDYVRSRARGKALRDDRCAGATLTPGSARTSARARLRGEISSS